MAARRHEGACQAALALQALVERWLMHTIEPTVPEPYVESYDFVPERTHNGRAFRILNIIDEYSRECLASLVARNIRHGDVQECLTELFCQRGVPVHLRSDNGTEFTTRRIREWLSNLGVGTLFIELGSPWENGYVESFNGRMRDELFDREIFYTVKETKHLIEMWRWEYSHVKPHSCWATSLQLP